MKIAVYTIAKNEEQFVESWYNSCKEADHHFILDTGSTDDTVSKARELGIHVEVKTFDPWRFDHSRNYSLQQLPHDIDLCIALDMDEVMVDGWRKHLDSLPADVTRPRYKYVWSWSEDGGEGLTYGGDKIHKRHGYYWKHPVHEVLTPVASEKQEWVGLQIHHYPDHSKPRSHYLPLLKLAVDEDPEDPRNAFYYARELYFYRYYNEAAKQFRRFLSLPRAVWKPERARAMRYMYDVTKQTKWLWDAVHECPERREGWVELAQLAYANHDWHLVMFACSRALSIKEKPLEYLNEEFAWNETPHDLMALAAYHLGFPDLAKQHGSIALNMNPGDERLMRNLQYYG